MRSKLLLLLFIPISSLSQIAGIEDYQKREAVSTVTRFCTLLSEWSNGQRELDTKLFSLCTGKDFSAYDDISTMKETSLRNYLFAIQQKFPKGLDMRISKPSMSKCKGYADSYIGFNKFADEYIPTSKVNTITLLPLVDTTTTYLSFDVALTIQNKTYNRKVIYNVQSAKISAFINGEGTYMSYLKGIELYEKRDYKQAISKFLYVAENKRSSLRDKSLAIAAAIYAEMDDYQSAKSIAQKLNDPFWFSYYEAGEALKMKRYATALQSFKKCEEAIGASSNASNYMSYIHLSMGIAHMLNHNGGQAVSYLKKAASEGLLSCYYLLYELRLTTNYINASALPDNDMYLCLQNAARNRLSYAYFEYAVYKEYIENRNQEATYWYYRTNRVSNGENPIADACLGRILMEKSQIPGIGGSYLLDAVQVLYGPDGKPWDKFNDYLNKYKKKLNLLTKGKFWIQSKNDVESYIKRKNLRITETYDDNDSIGAPPSEDYRPNVLYQWSREYAKKHPDRVELR